MGVPSRCEAAGAWKETLLKTASKRRYDPFKRAIDILAALAMLIVFFPIIALTWLLVWSILGSSALFWQARPGRDGKPFWLVKFRSMTNACDARGEPLPDADRLTRFGRMLRATSLDELPQFWNILKGEMSLVGPRPLLIDYLPLFTTEQARRHEVRPGLTGWAQVKGRNGVDWERRLAIDVAYVDNRSLWLDVQIIFRSIAIVVTGANISGEGGETMPAFKGSATNSISTDCRRQEPSASPRD
jgi:lipopolysaccharide/colanic/teichoic acid biosynthesis glycosyltransferase